MKKLIFLIILMILSSVAYAHIPIYPRDKTSIVVEDPELSRAYYGTVDEKVSYIIKSDKPFLLYVNILGPYKEEKPDLIFSVFSDGKLLHKAENIEWKYYYEEYGRDEYWRGSEFSMNATAGEYLVEVEGKGKYAFAIGRLEKFDLTAILRTLFVLPAIKADIFEKNYIAGIIALILALIIYFVFRKR